MMGALLLAALLSCTDVPDAAGDTGVDLGDDAPTLDLPDLSGVDMAAAYVEALSLARSLTVSTAWQGHVTSLSRARSGCPDIYVGAVEAADLDAGTTAVTWQDYCNLGVAAFGGWVSWDGSLQSDGEVDTPKGRTVDARRTLSGDGLVSTDAGTAFEFRGDASESVYLVEATDYQRFTWSSLVDATVTGADAFGDADAAGWRADMYQVAAGGDAPTLELRGNAWFFDARIADRFDSIDADLSFGADPSCSLEPHGWISLRDTDAFWYDLVFLPLTGDDGGDHGKCDGCGTLYVRGVETVEYGEVCPDFGDGWQRSRDDLPDLSTFVLTLREVLALEGS
ncbi:MAG: hypothetical protein D6798_09920 [Deltaproteobacteria bacterium]|nr:MAG: hypothetical protein D6798_09920 [Deltaproteobacteria bacterium]